MPTHLVIDDFTPPSVINQLGGALLGANATWKFRDQSSWADAVDPDDKNIRETPQFIHEIFHDKEKVITNCGYFQNYNHKLNILSK